jgi:transposase-like protein
MYNLNIKFVYADFESGIASAVRKVIPRARLIGCGFHYAQAIVRKLRSTGKIT